MHEQLPSIKYWYTAAELGSQQHLLWSRQSLHSALPSTCTKWHGFAFRHGQHTYRTQAHNPSPEKKKNKPRPGAPGLHQGCSEEPSLWQACVSHTGLPRYFRGSALLHKPYRAMQPYCLKEAPRLTMRARIPAVPSATPTYKASWYSYDTSSPTTPVILSKSAQPCFPSIRLLTCLLATAALQPSPALSRKAMPGCVLPATRTSVATVLHTTHSVCVGAHVLSSHTSPLHTSPRLASPLPYALLEISVSAHVPSAT